MPHIRTLWSFQFLAHACGAAVAFAGFILFAATAMAQVPAERERIEIGLSTNIVTITADFSGADLTIFGALDNADPLVQLQGRYDVIVVLEGPDRPIVVRRKDRVFGMWINMESRQFKNVPISYSVATTRMPQDITADKSYRQLALGADNIYLEPVDSNGDPATIKAFSDALRGVKKRTGLYSIRPGGVQFLSKSLFRATLSLPANVPVGYHKARAFLFKEGEFIQETSSGLQIVKSGMEQAVFDAAHNHGFFYGLFAVFLAIVTGWLGRLMFQRD